MKKTIWDKKIPTILGLGLITIGIILTSVLVRSGVVIIGQATPSDIPQNVRVSNVSDGSFTVSYATDVSALGSLNLGTDKNLGTTILDDRDQQGSSVTPRKIHNITVRNLTPQTTYFFSIISGQNTFLDNGLPFEISTGAPIQVSPSSQLPIAGRIIMPDGSAPNEALLYATSDNAEVISTLVKTDGSYILPLNSMRTKDFSFYFNFDKETVIKILAMDSSLKSNVLVSIQKTSPVPVITLGNDYDFTLSSTPIASQSAVLSGFPSLPVSSPSSSLKTQNPQILTPKKDQGFTDPKPQFKGTALPNEKVQIIIHSPDEIQGEATSDSYGNWTYRPPSGLSPGQHSISITTRGSFGILKTLTQSFTVYAAGTQVSESATPSATLTPSPTLPSPSVSVAPSPTPTPTIMPQISPIPTPTEAPVISQTKKELPPAGPSDIIVFGLMGIGIVAISGLLLLLSRKAAPSL